MSILITGSSGFIGSSLVKKLSKETIFLSSRSDALNWNKALKDVKTIVHLAARVHVLKSDTVDSLKIFRNVNVDETITLAKHAAESGVKKFIFLSSIKVNGEFTEPGCPFTNFDVPNPIDSYGLSKFEAENQLKELAKKTGLDIVIIRPPLVYGPGVKANFASLMKIVELGIPLPLSLVSNQRSLIGLDNLVDFILECIKNPKASNETFLISDGHDLSTPEIIRKIAIASGSNSHLFPFPVNSLKTCAQIFGCSSLIHRLCDNLQVDTTYTQQLLNWKPPYSVDECFSKIYN